jgi:hypothetical protein
MPEVALAIKGPRGAGKGMWFRALVRCFGEHGLHITNREHLTGRFNAHMRACLFLFADEAFWPGDHQGEKVLNQLITEDKFMLEQKGVDAGMWPNRLAVGIAANDEWVIPARDGERRYMMLESAATWAHGRADPAKRKTYFKALDHEMRNGGLAAMMHELMAVDLGDWHPREVPDTEALQQQKRRSLAPIDQWFLTMLEEGQLPGTATAVITKMGTTHARAITRQLKEDAVRRAPRLRNTLSDDEMVTYLEKWGCTRNKHITYTVKPEHGDELTMTGRGLVFLPLSELRHEWTRQFGTWKWDNQTEWGS